MSKRKWKQKPTIEIQLSEVLEPSNMSHKHKGTIVHQDASTREGCLGENILKLLPPTPQSNIIRDDSLNSKNINTKISRFPSCYVTESNTNNIRMQFQNRQNARRSKLTPVISKLAAPEERSSSFVCPPPDPSHWINLTQGISSLKHPHSPDFGYGTCIDLESPSLSDFSKDQTATDKHWK